MFVIIDNCAVDQLADAGANPVRDLRDTEFKLAYTPDLRTEYTNALAHASTAELAKNLIREILAEGTLYGFFGFGDSPCLGFDQGIWVGRDQYQAIESVTASENEKGLPRKRTDAHLAALAKNAVVLTNNTKEALWRNIPRGDGTVIQWSDFEEYLLRERNVAAALRACLLGVRP